MQRVFTSSEDIPVTWLRAGFSKDEVSFERNELVNGDCVHEMLKGNFYCSIDMVIHSVKVLWTLLLDIHSIGT